MSRTVDSLPLPANPRKMKVVIVSASRTGTLSLYSAMKILGFRPYHFYEVVFHGGITDMRIIQEAIKAAYNRLSGIKPIGKPDLDKWLADYDCLIELPSFMGMGAIEAYIEDPDVKFILTERDPKKWANSFNTAAGATVKMASSFPLNILRYFNFTLAAFLYLNQLAYWRFSGGLDPEHTGSTEALSKHYKDYIEQVKDILPKDRSLIIQLENGIGWEQICPFLELSIPAESYPPPNDQERFKGLLMKWLNPQLLTAVLRLGGVVVPVTGVIGYWGWSHWTSI